MRRLQKHWAAHGLLDCTGKTMMLLVTVAQQSTPSDENILDEQAHVQIHCSPEQKHGSRQSMRLLEPSTHRTDFTEPVFCCLAAMSSSSSVVATRPNFPEVESFSSTTVQQVNPDPLQSWDLLSLQTW